jgi:phytoene desaturase
MPDLFETFFEDFGRKREDYLQIQKLSPSYRVYFKDTEYDFVDVYDDLEKNREMFEKIEP